MEILFEVLVEIICEAFGEAILALGWESLAHAVRRRERANPLLAALGCALLGAVTGGLSLLIVPRRLLPRSGVPGVSLLLSPLLTGVVMRSYGELRRSRSRATTTLATFWGAATFAFCFALVRFLVYGRP